MTNGEFIELKSTVNNRKMVKRTLDEVSRIYLILKDFSSYCLVQRRLREELIMDCKYPARNKILTTAS